jgi:hypothetical protein
VTSPEVASPEPEVSSPIGAEHLDLNSNKTETAIGSSTAPSKSGSQIKLKYKEGKLYFQ